jgi:hypothetical protein
MYVSANILSGLVGMNSLGTNNLIVQIYADLVTYLGCALCRFKFRKHNDGKWIRN